MRIIFAFIFIAIASFAHADQYLCVADSASGFSYNEGAGAWGATKFKTTSKYIIKKSKADVEPDKYKVYRFGDDNHQYACNDFKYNSYLGCSSMWGEFRFQKNSGRFLASFMTGYYFAGAVKGGVTDSSSDTPYMEIGKCSSF